jgi:hypothetical protein
VNIEIRVGERLEGRQRKKCRGWMVEGNRRDKIKWVVAKEGYYG